jgi:nicotinamide riboside transporter PnuC
VLFGLLAAPIGLYLWHRQGSHFGLGEAKGNVNMRAALISATLLLALAGAELLRNVR